MKYQLKDRLIDTKGHRWEIVKDQIGMYGGRPVFTLERDDKTRVIYCIPDLDYLLQLGWIHVPYSVTTPYTQVDFKFYQAVVDGIDDKVKVHACSWKRYTGFTEVYDYCECGKKKELDWYVIGEAKN